MTTAKNKGKKGIGFYLLYASLSLVAMLPFPVLYFISDILYVLVYRLAGYRTKVVRKNLVNSFPEKSKKEIKAIEKKFYRHFCDYFVETIKTLRISEEQIRKRIVFTNPEMIDELTKDGNSCLLSLGHYCNWEWVISICLHLRPGVLMGHVYKRLSSKDFDEFFLKLRSRFNARPIEMKSIYRTIIQNRNKGQAMVIGFLNDQRPRKSNDDYWVTFLNQETPAQTGMERIAAQSGFSIVYLDLKKVKRGYYEGTVSMITADASKEEKHAVTDLYTSKLEETVKREPAYYLWTHNKWSRKRKKPKS